MLELAFGIFGLLMAVSGFCLLLMAVYVKLDYQVSMKGLRAVSVKKGGGSRYIMSSAFGTFFSLYGLSLLYMGQSAIA